jgi:hypothetical protein
LNRAEKEKEKEKEKESGERHCSLSTDHWNIREQSAFAVATADESGEREDERRKRMES